MITKPSLNELLEGIARTSEHVLLPEAGGLDGGRTSHGELKMCVVVLTGITSFYATPERQLMYGATPGFGMLRDCQLRVLAELASGGPTVEFGDDRR
jgi:hypothetical protein